MHNTQATSAPDSVPSKKHLQLHDIETDIRMSLGKTPSDLALVNVHVVDVFSCNVQRDACVLVGSGRVLAVLPSSELAGPNAKQIVDCEGRFLTPGFMDAHVHIESSMMTPEAFAAAVLCQGTVRVVADPHEIANVAGIEGLRYMLDASRNLPVEVLFALPSCVPCTPFEDSGARLGAEDLKPFLKDPAVVSLGEVMNCPGVLACDKDLLLKIISARNAGIHVDGHAPALLGRDLMAYAGCGVENDHECNTLEEMRQNIANGMYVFLREGSAAKDFETLARGLSPATARRCCLCTDDLHAADILAGKDINAILAKAVRLGISPALAVSLATLNPAEAYSLHHIGAVAPGYVADFCLVDDLEKFHVHSVYRAGKKVAENGQLVEPVLRHPVPKELLNSVHLASFSADKLRIPVPSGRARIIRMQPHSLITRSELASVNTQDGCFVPAKNPGLCKIAVVERHKNLGKVGVGILAGYVRAGEQLHGAIATSIAHDSHNIVVVGDNDADMVTAVQKVAQMQGGNVLVLKGEVVASMELTVGGLMSTKDAPDVARACAAVNKAASAFAVNEGIDPVISLSFMSLCVIPSLKVNTGGLFDVTSFQFVPVDAGEE